MDGVEIGRSQVLRRVNVRRHSYFEEEGHNNTKRAQKCRAFILVHRVLEVVEHFKIDFKAKVTVLAVPRTWRGGPRIFDGVE